MTYAKRVDANHKAVANTFQRLGWRWLDLSRVGGGAPDGLAWKPASGRFLLVEVKTPRGKQNVQQRAFAALWPVVVIRSVDEVIAVDREAA
jgi:hypothetical protein